MTLKEWLKKPVYIAVVWWTDSTLLGEDVTDPEDARIGLTMSVSCGVVVKVTKDYVALAHDFWEEGHFRTIQVISKKNIDKVKYMKVIA